MSLLILIKQVTINGEKKLSHELNTFPICQYNFHDLLYKTMYVSLNIQQLSCIMKLFFVSFYNMKIF